MEQPVLILGSEPRLAITIARSLARRGIPVDVAALSDDDPKVVSRSIRNFIRLPINPDPAGDDGEALAHLIGPGGYDFVISASDLALALTARHYERLGGASRLAAPPPPVVKRVLDKDITLDVARRCGVDVPTAYPIRVPEDLESLRDRLRFPVVWKNRSKTNIAEHTFKVRYLETFESLTAATRADAQFGSDALLQEYCPGEGVGIGVLIYRGELIAAFQHRRIKELPSTGGVGVLAVSEPLDPDLLGSALRLLRALEWEGVAMVEFRHDRATERAVLMEVNGRYWGTCSFPVCAGIDFPFYEWQIAHGRRPEVPVSYPVGLRWRWTAGYIQRLHGLFTDPVTDCRPRPSPWRELAMAVFDFGPSTRSALGSARDPIPAMSELARTMKALAIADARRILRPLVPCRLRNHLRMYRRLGADGGSCHLKLALARAARVRRNSPAPRALGSVRSILFVCHGNIIRSPMAAALMRRYLADPGGGRATIEIISAGLHADPGRGADERALVASREMGVSLDDHRSRPLTPEMVAEADLIFVMDYQNEARLLGRFPEAGHRVFLLEGRADDHRANGFEIADPYEGSMTDVRRCYQILDSRIRDLASRIFQPGTGLRRDSRLEHVGAGDCLAEA
jgi:protein-tyrosine-phosphatase/predicted ATP-grasp superfamily ATP-dependent carboligase